MFDTISVCLSKGIGCPVGSVLVGSEEDIHKALRIRKVFGGGMRQAGYLAAAGIYALDNHLDRLIEDHNSAKEIGEILSKLSFIKKVEPVETNIVIFEIDERIASENKFVSTLAEKGVSLIGMGQGKLSIVTHMNYTAEHHDCFIGILKSLNLI